MYTISDVLRDIDRGCMVYNMVEDKFSYRIVYFVNERNGESTKHYLDTTYNDLWKTLKTIIRNNLSLANSVVVAQTTALKNGKYVCLQSRPYSFSLDGYFQKICDAKEKEYISNNNGRRRANWC
ncbi:hypothetical protein IMSAGC020_01718 [Lachnospiraceae bacterium]|nr:hypothetical protein IMSAGC020_01718 [Lachnospiraceae bacterium]